MSLDHEQLRAVLKDAEDELERRRIQMQELSSYIGSLRQAIAGLRGYLNAENRPV